MADDTQDTLGPAVRTRSLTEGDVPEHLKRSYYTDGRGGEGLGFYTDARIQTAAFRDRGRDLVAARADPNAIRDMVAIAEHRGWSIVMAKGSNDFRREAWRAGRAAGLEVEGYRPTERDLQEFQRRQSQQQRAEGQREVRRERREDRLDQRDDAREVRRERRAEAGARAQLRMVDAVVRSRIADPERQDRVMAAARERVADWLERGARFDQPAAERSKIPERQRAR